MQSIATELPSLERGGSKNQFVAKMSRMLYGLPDSGRNFERYFDRFLRDACGAVPMVVDRSVYKILTKNGDAIYCEVFVDDVVFWGTSDPIVQYQHSAMRSDRNSGKTGSRVVGSRRAFWASMLNTTMRN